MFKVFNIVIVVVFLSIKTCVDTRLEPTKIIHNGIYKLEIQSEDKFLTGVENNNPIRSRWRNLPEQKWRFIQTQTQTTGTNGTTQSGWVISPINNIGKLSSIWKITYVGHGKFRFKSYTSDMCLHGSGSATVAEQPCHSYDPGQRWLILDTNE